MNTKIFTLLSNYSYLLGGIYLIEKKFIIYGLGSFMMWYISHNYHCNILNMNWCYLDMCFALFSFSFIIIKYFKNLFFYKIKIYLTIIAVFLFIGWDLYDYAGNDNNHYYNIIHSIWHILSALFIVYFITLN